MTAQGHEATPRAGWTAPAGKPPLSSRMMRATWRGLPARQHDVGWEPGLVVPAADGTPLLTDHYYPRTPGDFPTLIVRSPYGRGVPWSPQYGILFAEHGFHMVLQSCRGTGGSGGRFDLWRHEPADGLATVAWLRQQPWFTGTLGTIGPSYLSYAQWALALDPPPELRAMVVQVGLHDPYALFHTEGVLHLENALLVGLGMEYQHQGMRASLKATLRLQRNLRAITSARPLRGAHTAALGEVPWLDEVMAHPDREDPYWEGADLSGAAQGLRVPTALIAGWHDPLLGQTIEQYRRLRESGGEASLLVGAWTHTSALQRGWPEVFADSLAWLRAHLCGDPSEVRDTPVRVRVAGGREGEGAWRDLEEWPPAPGTVPWYPAEDGRLSPQPPPDAAPLASFRYDPDDPTPSVGGPVLSRTAGVRDNGALEARSDVLTFTGPVLDETVEVIGPVRARLAVSTETGHADVFARLCEVDGRGRSTNVCDGLGRLGDARRVDGAGRAEPAEVIVSMGPTAHRFAAGHRIRLQVSGGAHPRYARQPGTGESGMDATEVAAVRVVLHGGSVLELPAGP